MISSPQRRKLRPSKVKDALKVHAHKRQGWDSNPGHWPPEPASHFSHKKSFYSLSMSQSSCQARMHFLLFNTQNHA